jgi:hypothetical protein
MGTLPAAPRQMRIRDEPKDATAMRGQDRLEFRCTVNFSLKAHNFHRLITLVIVAINVINGPSEVPVNLIFI